MASSVKRVADRFAWDWAASAGRPAHDLRPARGPGPGCRSRRAGTARSPTNSDASSLGQVLGSDDHDLARRAFEFFQPAPDQFDRGQIRKQTIVVGMRGISGPRRSATTIGLAPVCSMKPSRTSAGTVTPVS